MIDAVALAVAILTVLVAWRLAAKVDRNRWTLMHARELIVDLAVVGYAGAALWALWPIANAILHADRSWLWTVPGTGATLYLLAIAGVGIAAVPLCARIGSRIWHQTRASYLTFRG